MLTPIHFGLPPKYTSWRPGQIDAFNQVADDLSDRRFYGICAPTGFGKSLVYMAIAKMMGLRTGVLTATKGMQDQLERDFAEISQDLRGQGNYRCPIASSSFGLPAYTSVDDAPCQCGYPCSLRRGGCEYFDIYRLAQQADIVVTNYQCWMHDEKKQKDLSSDRPVEMLILDEAHDAPEEVCKFLESELARHECLELQVSWPDCGYTVEEWALWGSHWLTVAENKLETLNLEARQGSTEAMKEVKVWKRMQRKLERISGMKDEWVIQEVLDPHQNLKSAHFAPLWPKHYTESVLFRGVSKVVLVSATLRLKTAELLGISTSTEDFSFQEYPSSFPIRSRPVIHVPTVRLNHRSSDYDLLKLIMKVDRLIEGRLDKKGVVHTVSYNRAQMLKLNSQYKAHMIVHDSKGRMDAIESFRNAGPGTVLVSPSVDTGYDFPYDQCEYQIILKLPFLDTRVPVVKARVKSDRDYEAYLIAMVIQQMTGRGMRAEDDRCETIVLDDNIAWFVRKNKQHFNKWWLQAYKDIPRGYMPEPLPKLEMVDIPEIVMAEGREGDQQS